MNYNQESPNPVSIDRQSYGTWANEQTQTAGTTNWTTFDQPGKELSDNVHRARLPADSPSLITVPTSTNPQNRVFNAPTVSAVPNSAIFATDSSPPSPLRAASANSQNSQDSKFDFSRIDKKSSTKRSLIGAAITLFIAGIILLVFAIVIVTIPLDEFDSSIFFGAGILCIIPGAYYIYVFLIRPSITKSPTRSPFI